MRKILLFLAIFVMCASAKVYAWVDCSAQFWGAVPGDRLHGSVHWNGLSDRDDGVRWYISTSSGTAVAWDRSTISPASPDASFTMNAGIANEAIWFTQTQGPNSTSCYFYNTSFDHLDLVVEYIGPNKNQASRDADNYRLIRDAVAFSFGSGCSGLPNPNGKFICGIIGTAVVKGFQNLADASQKTADDPCCVDNYWETFWPGDPGDLGMSCDTDHWLCGYIYDQVRSIVYYHDMAAGNGDRALTCQAYGAGCEGARINDQRWALQQVAQLTRNLSWAIAMWRDDPDSGYDPSTLNWVAQTLYGMARYQ